MRLYQPKILEFKPNRTNLEVTTRELKLSKKDCNKYTKERHRMNGNNQLAPSRQPDNPMILRLLSNHDMPVWDR